MLWLSRKDIEHISRRLLRDYLRKVPQKIDHIDPADFAEKMCDLQFTFADISEAHDAIGLTATSGVIITIPQRDGTRLDYELDGKTAFIDQSLVAENQIGRLNFTMMHEAAHQLFWMLYGAESYVPSKEDSLERLVYTGKQNRKVLATPVMESFASITGVTTLLRQKHGNCPPPPIFLHSIPFSFVRRSNHYLLLIPSSDGSHACAAEMVRYREERNYEP